MLDANLKAQLTAYLERMTQPVEITASLDDTAASREMRALLKDIADASPRVTVTETTPCFRAASLASSGARKLAVNGSMPTVGAIITGCGAAPASTPAVRARVPIDQ